MTTERALQAWITKTFRNHGMLVYKFASPAHRGVPDLVIISPGGKTIFVEVKNPNGTGRLSPLQTKTIQQMRSIGATVYVINSREAARDVLEALGFHPKAEGGD